MFIKFGSINFWVPKIFEKVLGPKKFESEKILLSMMGWISKGGVGMRVPFLGFRVAYIPNLSLLQSLEPFEKGSKI